MPRYIFFLFIFFAAFTNLKAQTEQAKPFTIGEIKQLDSKVLAEKRILNIYLPDGYKKTDTITYPVIYLLDGSVNEDFIHIVGLVQFFNMAINMPPTIIVGIANVDRRRDLTFPTQLKDLKKDYPTTGGSQKFIDFIETELQPYIDKTYKTTTQKTIIGQSLGGLLSVEILLKKPALFTNYIIVSPSLWWDNESLLKNADSLFARQEDFKLQVYISAGTEGKIMEEDAKGIATVLKKSNKKNIKVDFVLLPNENHATILHQAVYEAFKILYPYKK